VDHRTRAIIVNSPSNPTGWMASQDELRAIVDFARPRAIWVISDEVYARITYDTPVAPSVLEVANEDDRVLVVNSFSKTWAMTGWRIGWLTMPKGLHSVAAEMIECMTSGVTTFAQFGALAALLEGETFVEGFRAYCAVGRQIVSRFLTDLDGITYSPPAATFYAFFAVDRVEDSFNFAKRLVRDQGVAVAPGAAFGRGSDGWFRLCFAQNPKLLTLGLERIRAGITSR
jgi:aspartate aminotransferase